MRAPSAEAPRRPTPYEAPPRPEVPVGPLEERAHLNDGRLALSQCLSLLREIREEIQNFQDSIDEVKKKGELKEATTRANEIIVAFSEADAIFRRNARAVDERFRSIDRLLEEHPDIRDWCSDTVTGLGNYWERMKGKWGDSPTVPDARNASAHQLYAESVLRRVTGAAEYIPPIIRDIGMLTIPPRVNQHLRNLRVGQALDFHAAFKDEMPLQEHREWLLTYIRSQPAAIDGLVEGTSGRILKAATTNGWRRLLSYVLLAGLVLVGGLVSYGIGYVGDWLGLTDWPFAGRSFELLGGYVFLMLGALAHGLVDVVKQARAKDGGSFTALGEGWIWVHVKEVPNAVAIVTLWFGLAGVALAGKVEWLTAFAAGYGIDSVIDVFLKRFDTSIGKAVDSLKPAEEGTAK